MYRRTLPGPGHICEADYSRSRHLNVAKARGVDGGREVAVRRDGVSVYVSAELAASAETLTEIATAIDADLQAGGV